MIFASKGSDLCFQQQSWQYRAFLKAIKIHSFRKKLYFLSVRIFYSSCSFLQPLQWHFSAHCRSTLKKAGEPLEWKLLLYMGYSCSQCVIYASSSLLSIFPNKQRLRSYGNRNESVSVRSGWASQPLYKNIQAIFLFFWSKVLFKMLI